jgi:hypothetical protein
MIRRYQDLALRLAARLARRDDLDDLDLRVLRAYFTLASEDREVSPPTPRDQTTTTEGTGAPPYGTTAALVPWGLLLGKANPPVEGDPLLLLVVVAFYSYLAFILWRSS